MNDNRKKQYKQADIKLSLPSADNIKKYAEAQIEKAQVIKEGTGEIYMLKIGFEMGAKWMKQKVKHQLRLGNIT